MPSNHPTTVSQYSGVRVPVSLDALFLGTVAAYGAPPQRPGLQTLTMEKDDDLRQYFERVIKHWREQNCTGDPYGFMVFYNTKFVPWLNHQHAMLHRES
jgi:hypothetical protein